jgi:hypothetical protein
VYHAAKAFSTFFAEGVDKRCFLYIMNI